jgi:hypothetical protein
MKRLILHGKTNDGQVVKQYCYITEDKSKGFEKSVIIHRFILTDNYDDYVKTGHSLLKSFKGKGLFLKSLSIKISTLEKIMKFAKSK